MNIEGGEEAEERRAEPAGAPAGKWQEKVPSGNKIDVMLLGESGASQL